MYAPGLAMLECRFNKTTHHPCLRIRPGRLTILDCRFNKTTYHPRRRFNSLAGGAGRRREENEKEEFVPTCLPCTPFDTLYCMGPKVARACEAWGCTSARPMAALMVYG